MTFADHIHLLDDWAREVDLMLLKHDMDLRKLRAELVEKYGEDGVARVEARLKGI